MNAAWWQTRKAICDAHAPQLIESFASQKTGTAQWNRLEAQAMTICCSPPSFERSLCFWPQARHSSFLHFPSRQIRQHRARWSVSWQARYLRGRRNIFAWQAQLSTFPFWLRGANYGFCKHWYSLVLEQCHPPFEDATLRGQVHCAYIIPLKNKVDFGERQVQSKVTRETNWSAWWHEDPTTLKKMKP